MIYIYNSLKEFHFWLEIHENYALLKYKIYEFFDSSIFS